jgi:hypothetical protein
MKFCFLWTRNEKSPPNKKTRPNKDSTKEKSFCLVYKRKEMKNRKAKRKNRDRDRAKGECARRECKTLTERRNEKHAGCGENVTQTQADGLK